VKGIRSFLVPFLFDGKSNLATMTKILLVEDDLSYSRIIKTFLEKNNFEVISANSVSKGLQLIAKEQPNLVIVDYRLPDGTGLQLLETSLNVNDALPFILITSYIDIRTAVKAMKLGAFEYITKPINPDELLETVKDALRQETPNSQSKKTEAPDPKDHLVGKSQASQQIYAHISIVAPTDLSVLILGETGTGKEYAARKIHLQSPRSSKPFVAVDCGALSKELAASELFGHLKGSFTGALDDKTGHFEFANGGTIFLDEVGNLPYEVQVKLLRAIEERRIRKIGANNEIPLDIRIIAATNEDMRSGIQNGSFREDLFHRLNEFQIILEPLRRRREDIMQFAEFFVNQSNIRLGKSVTDFEKAVKEIFESYSWPGNLRELKNIVRRGVLLAPNSIFAKDLLPEELIAYANSSKTEIEGTEALKIESQESDLIRKALQESNNNKSLAAKLLGIDRKTLYNKLAKLHISQQG
jgi:two-component system response regulator HydG